MIEAPKQLTLRTKFPRPTAAQVAAFIDVPTGFVCDAMGGVGGMETAISPLVDPPIAGCAGLRDNGSTGCGPLKQR